jgi:hypothetical protein
MAWHERIAWLHRSRSGQLLGLVGHAHGLVGDLILRPSPASERLGMQQLVLLSQVSFSWVSVATWAWITSSWSASRARQ